MQNTQAERRRFFRIDDNVSLAYRLIDQATADKGLQAAGHFSSNHSLAATMDVLSQEALLIMQRMAGNNKDCLELYKVLDAKINAVAQAIMFVGSNVNAQNCQDVNLSASGIAFHHNQAMDIGQNLAIEIYLPTTLALIQIFGQVVDCRLGESPSLEPEHYQISVDFTHIREEDQELLIKHVVRVQWQQLRAKNGMLNL